MYILFAILIFSVLIFVHELGHFLAAKASGVQVNEFAMFMGPAIWKKQVGETLYSLRCIPLGGYCAMEGEDEDTENPRSFQKAAWWKRLIILVAGAAMNFLIGLLILAIVLAPAQAINVLEVQSFEEWSTLDDGGLQVGDRILELDGEKMYLYSDFSMVLSLNPGDVHDLVVERNGEKLVFENYKMETHTVTDDQGNEVQKYGVTFGHEELTFFGKIRYVWLTAIDWIRTVRLSLTMLFTGQAGLAEVTGPVGIVSTMNDMAQSSPTVLDAVMNLLYFGAYLAVNLAVMNLLPIPALDGGRVFALLLTTAIEGITKKKINPKYEGYIHGAGMILLLALMAIIMFKDIFTIFAG